jgi:hypothetical protein
MPFPLPFTLDAIEHEVASNLCSNAWKWDLREFARRRGQSKAK